MHRALGDELGEFVALDVVVRASAVADVEVTEACAAMRTLLARHPEWPLQSSGSLAGVEAWACTLREGPQQEATNTAARSTL